MDITKIPNKILSSKVSLVKVEDLKKGSFKELILDMKKIMKENQGVGLAANQISKNLSIFIIEENIAKDNGVSDVFINPEIADYSKEKDYMEEGCLSIPEYFTQIKRSKKIRIKALNENGEKMKIKAKGFLARILQHETDHLNGMTIKDRESEK